MPFNLDFFAGFMAAVVIVVAIALFSMNRPNITFEGLEIYFRHLLDRKRPLHRLWCPFCKPEPLARALRFGGINTFETEYKS